MDDGKYEGDETVDLTLLTDPANEVGAPATATVTIVEIADDD